MGYKRGNMNKQLGAQLCNRLIVAIKKAALVKGRRDITLYRVLCGPPR